MAAVLQSSLQIAKRQVAPATCAAVLPTQPKRNGSDLPRIQKPSLSQMKKGPGGRSSFNGVVATVFGATGFLGNYVCNQLGKSGTQLILPYRGDSDELRPLKLVGDLGQVLFNQFHLRDEESLRKVIRYSNVVINLIGRDWETKNFTFNDVHVDGARRIARIAREEGVERLIHLSALNCSPNPTPRVVKKGSALLRSKYYGELAVREEFPDAIIIRPSVVYGIPDRFLFPYSQPFRRSFRYIPVWRKGEDTIKAPVFANDIARAIHQAIRCPDAPGKCYQAVGPYRYKLSDLIDWIFLELRRYPEDGYRRVNLHYSTIIPLMWLLERVPGTPPVALASEVMEREVTTDEIHPGLPTLEDLGVTPSAIEDEAPWILSNLRRCQYYKDSVGEFPTSPLPPRLELNL